MEDPWTGVPANLVAYLQPVSGDTVSQKSREITVLVTTWHPPFFFFNGCFAGCRRMSIDRKKKYSPCCGGCRFNYCPNLPKQKKRSWGRESSRAQVRSRFWEPASFWADSESSRVTGMACTALLKDHLRVSEPFRPWSSARQVRNHSHTPVLLSWPVIRRWTQVTVERRRWWSPAITSFSRNTKCLWTGLACSSTHDCLVGTMLLSSSCQTDLSKEMDSSWVPGKFLARWLHAATPR